MEREITGIKAQKKNPERVSIYLDGEYGFGLSRIVAAWLQIGERLDEKKIESLLDSDANEVAYTKALKLINLKPRTEKEIRSKLVADGFSEDQCDTVLQRLCEAGLVEDDRYARQWVENRNELHPRSRMLISMELRHKGIADEVIEQVLEDSATDEDLALMAATQYARKLSIDDGMEFRRRLSAFLVRRGFSYGTIAPVVRSVWELAKSEDTYPED